MQHHRVIATIDAHQSSVVCVAWNPNGREFASASEDTLIRIWEIDHSIQYLNLAQIRLQTIPALVGA